MKTIFKAIKIKGQEIYFGSPMMIIKQGLNVPNYTKNINEASFIKESEKELYFSQLPIKMDCLELVSYQIRPIKLKPLCMIALSSQLYRLTGNFWNSSSFLNLDGSEATAKHNNIIVEIGTGKKFLLPSQEVEEKAKIFKQELERAAKERAVNKYNHIKHPFIDYHNSERWKTGLEALKGNAIIEMCEDAYYNFLECVPPRRFDSITYVSGEPNHHNEKGEEVFLCGIKKGKKFFAQYGTVSQYDKKELFKNIPL